MPTNLVKSSVTNKLFCFIPFASVCTVICGGYIRLHMPRMLVYLLVRTKHAQWTCSCTRSEHVHTARVSARMHRARAANTFMPVHICRTQVVGTLVYAESELQCCALGLLILVPKFECQITVIFLCCCVGLYFVFFQTFSLSFFLLLLCGGISYMFLVWVNCVVYLPLFLAYWLFACRCMFSYSQMCSLAFS